MLGQELLGDTNPMVVANTLAALTEIKDTSAQDVVQYIPQLLFKLLRALNECTEWGWYESSRAHACSPGSGLYSS